MRSIRKKREAVGRKSLISRFVYLYTMNVVNDDERRRVFKMRVSHLYLVLFIIVLLSLGAWAGIEIYSNSPQQKNATHEDYLLRQSIVNDALRIDSLEHIFDMQNRYITNLQDIIAGSVSIDTVYSVDSLARQRNVQIMERTEREESFVRQYEEAERYNITSQSQPVNDVRSITMFRPTAGLISRHYDAMESHLGVDIIATPNQSVVAVMDGTVLMSSYTSDMGYTICIVHPGELISVYKHCQSLIKKSGDRIKQGEVVALVGRADAGTPQVSHLHYELWYKGETLDPEKYILFQ